MGLPRSTYYDTPATEADTEIVARITAICEEFEAYQPVSKKASLTGFHAIRRSISSANGKKFRHPPMTMRTILTTRTAPAGVTSPRTDRRQFTPATASFGVQRRR